MDNFRIALKRRLFLMGGFNIAALAFITLTLLYRTTLAPGSESLADMTRGFQVGIFVGFQVMLLLDIIKSFKALRNEQEIKKLYIAEHDERAKFIQDKIGGMGLNISLAVLAVAAIIAGFFHQLVFITLVGVIVFMSLVKGTLKLYYRNKF